MVDLLEKRREQGDHKKMSRESRDGAVDLELVASGGRAKQIRNRYFHRLAPAHFLAPRDHAFELGKCRIEFGDLIEHSKEQLRGGWSA